MKRVSFMCCKNDPYINEVMTQYCQYSLHGICQCIQLFKDNRIIQVRQDNKICHYHIQGKKQNVSMLLDEHNIAGNIFNISCLAVNRKLLFTFALQK